MVGFSEPTVTIKVAPEKLAGNLLLPVQPTKPAIVLLIAESGSTDRADNLASYHQSNRPLAGKLKQQLVAFLTAQQS
jgi:hypothetical protein